MLTSRGLISVEKVLGQFWDKAEFHHVRVRNGTMILFLEMFRLVIRDGMRQVATRRNGVRPIMV